MMKFLKITNILFVSLFLFEIIIIPDKIMINTDKLAYIKLNTSPSIRGESKCDVFFMDKEREEETFVWLTKKEIIMLNDKINNFNKNKKN